MEGEAPLTNDLVTIADSDFKKVSIFSIVAIFLIIMVIFKSISVPVLLVLAIELAIFINLGIPYYTGTTIPFISSIVIGTIQLGATVDMQYFLLQDLKKSYQTLMIRRKHDKSITKFIKINNN